MNERVTEAITNLERFMTTVDDALALPREAARFVHALLRASGARRALEIGTSYGYSGLWIAAALAEQDGRLVTVDRSERKTRAAQSALESAGLSGFVEFRTGSALEVLPELSGPFDFVLNDADKENCVRYVELVMGKLSPRAFLLTDNTLTHPGQLAEFMAWMRRRTDFFTVNVPIGNGMDLSVRL
ncbi:MAG: class I SAM-dependent methyltransferase [Planctomycetes bacterium]|nr:class I SAM-dependent methyltransferase [Planctomycetota bacterium]